VCLSGLRAWVGRAPAGIECGGARSFARDLPFAALGDDGGDKDEGSRRALKKETATGGPANSILAPQRTRFGISLQRLPAFASVICSH
jgi:hypothetical protein